MTVLGAVSVAALAVSVGCSTFGTDEPVASEAGAVDATTDGAAVPFCQSADAAFCADFEQGALDVGFMKNPALSGGSLDLELVDGGALPGHALHAVAYPLDAGEDAAGTAHGSLLMKSLTLDDARGFRIELDVRLDALPPDTFVAFAGLATNEGSVTESSVLVSFQSTSGYVLVGRGKPTTSTNNYTFPLPPPLRWTHVRLDVDLDTAKVALTLDGNPVVANENGIGRSSVAVSGTVGIITLPVARRVASVAVDNFTLQRIY